MMRTPCMVDESRAFLSVGCSLVPWTGMFCIAEVMPVFFRASAS